MIVAIVIVMILGTNDVGGVGNVFEAAEEGKRLIWFKWVGNFNIDSGTVKINDKEIKIKMHSHGSEKTFRWKWTEILIDENDLQLK